MSFDIFIPSADPYAGFFKLLGGKPPVLCHGDDLPAGTVTTWDARHGALDGTTTNSPTRNDTGWAGGGGLTMPTLTTVAASSQRVNFDAEASNYSASTGFTWVLALKIASSAAVRYPFFLGSSSTGNNWRGLGITAADLLYMSSNRSGASQTQTGTAVTEATQIIIAASVDPAGTLNSVQRTSSGPTTLHSAAAITMSGTLNVNRFTLGSFCNNGNYTVFMNGDFRFVAAMRGGNALDVSELETLTSYVQHRLRCPL